MPPPVRNRIPLPNRHKRGRSQGGSPKGGTFQDASPRSSLPNKRKSQDDDFMKTSEPVDLDATTPLVFDMSNDITPAQSVSGQMTIEETMDESDLQGLPRITRVASLIAPDIPEIREARTTSATSSMTTHQGSSSSQTRARIPPEDYYSVDVSFHSNVPIRDKPRHIFLKMQKEVLKIRLMSLHPNRIGSVVIFSLLSQQKTCP